MDCLYWSSITSNLSQRKHEIHVNEKPFSGFKAAKNNKVIDFKDKKVRKCSNCIFFPPPIHLTKTLIRLQVLSEGFRVAYVTPRCLHHSPRGEGVVMWLVKIWSKSQESCEPGVEVTGRGKPDPEASGADTGRGCWDTDQSGPDHTAHPRLRPQAMINRLPHWTAWQNGCGHTVHTAGSKKGQHDVTMESVQGHGDVTGSHRGHCPASLNHAS